MSESLIDDFFEAQKSMSASHDVASEVKSRYRFAHKINSLSLSILVAHLTARDGGNVDIAWSIYRPCATGIANKSAIP